MRSIEHLLCLHLSCEAAGTYLKAASRPLGAELHRTGTEAAGSSAIAAQGR